MWRLFVIAATAKQAQNNASRRVLCSTSYPTTPPDSHEFSARWLLVRRDPEPRESRPGPLVDAAAPASQPQIVTAIGCPTAMPPLHIREIHGYTNPRRLEYTAGCPSPSTSPCSGEEMTNGLEADCHESEGGLAA
jgi:hypothetical protein